VAHVPGPVALERGPVAVERRPAPSPLTGAADVP
jgi:hypothetical protein